MKLRESELAPHEGRLIGKRIEANSASLGGCLLQAASEAPLDSPLSHLPRNYSSRAGGEGETSIDSQL